MQGHRTVAVFVAGLIGIAACSVYDVEALGGDGGPDASPTSSATTTSSTFSSSGATTGAGGDATASTTSSSAGGASGLGGGGSSGTGGAATGGAGGAAGSVASGGSGGMSSGGAGGSASGGAAGSTSGGGSGRGGSSGGGSSGGGGSAGGGSSGAGGSSTSGASGAGGRGGSGGGGGSGGSGGKAYTGTPYQGIAAPVGAVVSMLYPVEGENYDVGGEGVAFHDTSPTNTLGAYRTGSGESVDVEAACGVGCDDIADIAPGEWTKYTVSVVTGGTYKVQLGAASATSRNMHIEVDGVNVTGALAVNTGGATIFKNIDETVTFTMTAGQHVVTFFFDDGFMALNWVKFQRQ